LSQTHLNIFGVAVFQKLPLSGVLIFSQHCYHT